ncbi:oxidoreductase [Paenibacillus sp. S150]|uniref:oxidoreductase n=1 Tax=Paenibacillus sp. S150 TaxID=2749826 RepID=UPI001C55D55B|nr:oxidoreductase [Paenibacillus sp. S150]MBW4081196.1 SDR family NAD(P)-dependent oxidoreductase [Paenibacillus sp. S150]
MTTRQHPISSGFGASSTTDDVIRGLDLSGTTAIVTGGYAGLGLETTRTLVSAGANVIVPARDLDKARQALAGLKGAEIEEMDLIDPNSIDTFAAGFLASGRPLHILVNSAGIMGLPELTKDGRGFEYHFATNHLGHFQLTGRLWPALRRAGGARVVSVSAWAHRQSKVIYDDPNFERREYKPMLGYGQSKTANILFAVGVDKRGRDEGIRAFALHPGSIITDLARYATLEQLRNFGVVDDEGQPIIDPARQLKTIKQGAATQVWCATHPKLNGLGGVYCENVEVASLVLKEDNAPWKSDDSTRQVGVMPYAVDPEEADRLWSLSEQLLGLQLP